MLCEKQKNNQKQIFHAKDDVVVVTAIHP
jgi:hypothetical protein